MRRTTLAPLCCAAPLKRPRLRPPADPPRPQVAYTPRRTLESIKGVGEEKVKKIIEAAQKMCQMGFQTVRAPRGSCGRDANVGPPLAALRRFPRPRRRPRTTTRRARA